MNGWNHISREKNTVYKLIEVLNTKDVDHKLSKDHEHMNVLHEISPIKIDFQDYMMTHGCITNILVRYFREMSSSLLNTA